MSKYNWTRQETKDLITLYEINECLWNKNLREYKDRDERISSIQSISDEMKISIEEINKKIHNLRNQYRFELNKTKKKIPGKPQYKTKWPYFGNLSFLENVVSVRGSNTSQTNSTGEYADTNEYTVEKYEEENENSSEKVNNINNNNDTTIVTANGNAQPQQIFHVSVEYEEPKPKQIKTEVLQSARKRRLMTKDGNEIAQHHMLKQYVQPTTSTPKPAPTIIIDDKSQDHEIKNINEADETFGSVTRPDEVKKFDNFDVFGMFVANEMRSLQSQNLQKKLKRKILECVLEVNDLDSDQNA
ncbi:CLUMA_CG009638, isoform A [Clunio marinus]|uniref:CLUMA_CG009638, isoform A n=1 Tax=Clunio marinus TaxID=568069 RepID=A0A1J1I907_9DIPT|nr:CLUMA_CG009638, isoform A [Clunio marinus]